MSSDAANPTKLTRKGKIGLAAKLPNISDCLKHAICEGPNACQSHDRFHV